MGKEKNLKLFILPVKPALNESIGFRWVHFCWLWLVDSFLMSCVCFCLFYFQLLPVWTSPFLHYINIHSCDSDIAVACMYLPHGCDSNMLTSPFNKVRMRVTFALAPFFPSCVFPQLFLHSKYKQTPVSETIWINSQLSLCQFKLFSVNAASSIPWCPS